MTRQVLFLIPLVLILPKFFGLNGILYAAPIADFVAFVVSVICILAEFKKLNELEKYESRLSIKRRVFLEMTFFGFSILKMRRIDYCRYLW